MRLVAGMILAAVAAGAGTYDARHQHLRNSCQGRLTVGDQGVGYESENKKSHSWKLAWTDIQEMRVLDDGEARVLSYQDRSKWLLGTDRVYHLWVADKEFVAAVTPVLRERLGRRFVAGLAQEVKPLWEIPVKQLLRFSGVEGTLAAASDRIQFRAARPGYSREWTFAEIDNLSTSDPYQLTITTLERARGHYGDRKGFNFRLKQPLDAERYNRLWRQVEVAKGLQVLSLADEKRHEP